MKNSFWADIMLPIFLVILIVALLWLRFFRPSSYKAYGDRLAMPPIEIYYKGTVSKSEAKLVGAYIEKAGFVNIFVDTSSLKDKNTIVQSFQLLKREEVYVFNLMIKEAFYQDPELLQVAQDMADSIAQNVFEQHPIEVHICNNSFETKQILKAP